jgi:hypothetical protein
MLLLVTLFKTPAWKQFSVHQHLTTPQSKETNCYDTAMDTSQKTYTEPGLRVGPSVHMKLWTRQIRWWQQRFLVLGNSTRKLLGSMEMVYILMVVVNMQLYKSVKTHQFLYLNGWIKA